MLAVSDAVESVFFIVAGTLFSCAFACSVVLVARFLRNAANAPRVKKAARVAAVAERIEQIGKELQAVPGHPSLHDELRRIVADVPGAAGHAYRVALDAVSMSGGATECKTLALEMGRAHFADIRDDGKVTSYDEQSMLNDISVRS